LEALEILPTISGKF